VIRAAEADSRSASPQRQSPDTPLRTASREQECLSPTPLRPKLLLVEDDPATSHALRALLARKGWDVQVASTLAEAQRQLENHPDWLVLDLMLPDGDGMSLLKKVRDERLNVRVAITTGTSDPARLRKVRELRPDLVLFKPIDLDELFAALQRA